MYTTNLRKVGGSVMLALPPALLELLGLEAGSVVGVSVDGEKLILQPRRQPKYSLQELLEQCDYSLPQTAEEREWMDAPAVGEEML